MDKILLIDAMNALWRANVRFGPRMQHTSCTLDCRINRHPEYVHCYCGAKWNEKEQFCYGDKYLVVFNFFRNLRPIIELLSPDKCFFVLEGHAKHRYALYPDYKANRLHKIASTAEKQEDLAKFFQQKDLVVDLLQYFPISLVKSDDYEADDVMATLAKNLLEEDVTILSNDSDFIQLIQQHKQIKVYNPIAKEYLQPPSYFYLGWKCLCGDKADNIPGFMGDKTAQKTISDPDKFAQWMAVEENRANFNINKQLIEFQDVPLEQIQIVDGITNWNIVKHRFDEMAFYSITNEKSWQKFTSTFDCIKI